MEKQNKVLIFFNILIHFLIFIAVVLSILSVLFSFKDKYTNVLEGYCESSGGSWNFYECYNSPISHCEDLKTGNWCDYPDGTSKSEDEISWMFNSTI